MTMTTMEQTTGAFEATTEIANIQPVETTTAEGVTTLSARTTAVDIVASTEPSAPSGMYM